MSTELKAIYSRPRHEREGTDLVMFFHGYGSSEQRMAELFDAVPANATAVALRGGLEIGEDYGWFLLDYFLTHDFSEVLSATQRVYHWIDTEARGYKSISLVGFSQGMAMASTLQRLRPRQFTCVAGLSGFVLSNELLAMTEDAPHEDPAQRPPYFWGRDVDDVVINPDAVEHSRSWLEDHTRLTARTYPYMGHRVGAEEKVDLKVFLSHYVKAAAT